MTAVVNVTAEPPGPKYSMASAPWRKEKTVEDKSPGPGEQVWAWKKGGTTSWETKIFWRVW